VKRSSTATFFRNVNHTDVAFVDVVSPCPFDPFDPFDFALQYISTLCIH
jgi:hypothetical protein